MTQIKLPKLRKINPNRIKKKKILLMSDDLRMHSGVATVSKDIVLETIHKYDWVQIAGAINHPESGKIFDMSSALREEYGLEDPYLKIYPVDGYGNPDLLREVIDIEKPDAILHYTDPRFWIWLYNMEHEIRQNIPIFYYNIWDDLPDPYYNENYYRSSDLLMGISKQTYGINKRILSDYANWQIKYVPHGINSTRFHKVEDKNDTKFKKFESDTGLDKFKFKLLYSNRNIRRKVPGDVVMAYKHFMDKLTPEQQKECCLVFHTQPSDDNGTDLRAVCKRMIPDYNVLFTYDTYDRPFNDDEMNFLFNSADVYINMASNEGFGLGSCEALSVGTPIIVNVTGGLQDQCGFKKKDGKYITADEYIFLGSNHKGEYKEHGEWVKPIFPSNISLQGSPLTPYIFDDRCSSDDAGEAIGYWYEMGKEERDRCGDLGLQFVKDKNVGMDSKEMGNRFIEAIDETFEKWKPRKRYSLEAV
ncbi:MAG: glycosyltransferase [Candidatus Pelagibacter sp.]|nr:glycosyltransferase [Candidatus Pelagibacter sp.]